MPVIFSKRNSGLQQNTNRFCHGVSPVKSTQLWKASYCPVAFARLSNEPHSCGFPEGLQAQPFYGWVKRGNEFLRGAFSLLSSPAFSQHQLLSSLLPKQIIVPCIVAINSLSEFPAMPKTSARTTVSVLPALITSARATNVSPCAGRSRFTLDSTLQT